MKKQRKEKKDRRTRKIYFLIAALALLMVGSLAGWLLLTKGEVSFEEAMKEPSVREDFIEKIVEEIGKPSYIAEINYVDTLEEFEFLERVYGFLPNPNELMCTNPIKEVAINQLGKEVVPVRISIFPFAFSGETLKTENDFVSSLLHEYHHAEALNIGKIDSIDFEEFLIVEGEFKGKYHLSLINCVLELTAIKETLYSPLKISEEYRAQRKEYYFQQYLWIWDYEEGVDPEFIKLIKIEFFEPWMLNSPSLVKEMREGREIWYFENTKTGQRFYLPEEIVKRFSQNGKG